jgi:hypothetical protein
VVRPPPLITFPPKQPPPKQLVPKRSRRIAAQQMDHIPASKRGGAPHEEDGVPGTFSATFLCG